MTFDSRPVYTAPSQPTSGYWLNNLPSTVTVTSAKRTIYIDSRMTNVSWSYAGSGASNQQWPLPTLDSTAPVLTGLTAYSTTYAPSLSSPWTRVANGQPPFVIATYGVYFKLAATLPAGACGGVLNFRNSRTAVLSNGQTLYALKSPATA